MAKRNIITINEDLCNGCGDCISACSEGALQLIDGKAKLVKEQYCDGLGDCLGECPTGALVVEERECDEFDYAATEAHVEQQGGQEAKKRFQKTAEVHGLAPAPEAPKGCPGTRMRESLKQAPSQPAVQSAGGPKQAIPSELNQWPVQLHLVGPQAPFFNDKELVVLSTCAPVASADVHWRFLRGRSVVVACPKLDRTEPYVEKLTGIFSNPTIPKVIIVRMEVPCCGGLSQMVKQAVAQCGRSDLIVEEVVVSLNGDI